MSVNERVKILIDSLTAGNKAAFAKAIGVGAGVVQDIIGGRLNKPSFDVLSKIVNTYPQVNTDWLVKGEGEMIKQPGQPAHNGNGMPLVVAVESSGRENIVMVDTKAAAGYIKHHLEPEYIKDLPALSLPGQEFRNATFRSFQVQGDSMTPGIQNGDFVIASYVHNWPTNIQDGYVYVVVTHHDVLVKRLLNRIPQRGKVVIQSDNEAWPTDEIDADDIIELWRAKAKISFKFPNMRYDTHKKIASLEADVFELKQLVMKVLPK